MPLVQSFSARKRLVAILACVVILTVFLMDRQLQMTNISIVNSKAALITSRIKHDEGFQKLVHLDLKGAPPLFSYLLELLPLFRQLGATGLLVEYEDMFPYEGVLRKVPKSYAYTSEQIKTFLLKAKENNLEVIPLVQTLGHLEFVLKKKEFQNLREQPFSDCCICPTRNESLIILHSMIDDILRAHPDARWIHLGGDEVTDFKKCTLCRATKKSPTKLYTDHVVGLMEYVRIRSNNRTRSIIWDDMMRDWSNDSLSNINKYGDVMLWNYAPDLRGVFNRDIVRKYAKAFDTVWVASAFKGADGIDADFVPIGPRITNNRIWREIVGELRSQGCGVQGLALTGWSRYYHHSGYCELMPSGIPSLALCLNEWKDDYNVSYFNDSLQKLSIVLGFKDIIKLNPPSQQKPYVPKADFPGSDVYRLVAKFNEMTTAEKELKTFEVCYRSANRFETCRHLKVNHTSAYSNLISLKMALLKLQPRADAVLGLYFSNDTRESWTKEKIMKHLQSVALLEKQFNGIQVPQPIRTQYRQQTDIQAVERLQAAKRKQKQLAASMTETKPIKTNQDHHVNTRNLVHASWKFERKEK